MASRLVPATITLWSKVAARMLPTPAKFHYLFNMRELSKVALRLAAKYHALPPQAATGACGVAEQA